MSSRRLPYTPDSMIKNVLRRLWMWSRERSAALKAAGGKCECCGSTHKLEVHHIDGLAVTKELIALIRRRLLPPPDRLRVMCKECHASEHGDQR